MPGTLGTMKSMLNPAYVIKEQSYDQGATAGRVADLGPALDRWSQKPFFGTGFGTTVADPNASKESEAQILDDQWLGSLLEIGAVGVLALLFLWVGAVRRLNRWGRQARGSERRLAVHGAGGVDHLVRRRDAHLRRLRVHPGDVLRVRDARPRRRSLTRRPAASAQPEAARPRRRRPARAPAADHVSSPAPARLAARRRREQLAVGRRARAGGRSAPPGRRRGGRARRRRRVQTAPVRSETASTQPQARAS